VGCRLRWWGGPRRRRRRRRRFGVEQVQEAGGRVRWR